MNARKLNPAEITFKVNVEQDDQHVRGNAMASGDEATDRACEDLILASLEKGNVWVWACVEVEAEWAGFKGRAVLGACSYDSAEDFANVEGGSSGYLLEMAHEAIADAVKSAKDAGWPVEVSDSDIVAAVDANIPAIREATLAALSGATKMTEETKYLSVGDLASNQLLLVREAAKRLTKTHPTMLQVELGRGFVRAPAEIFPLLSEELFRMAKHTPEGPGSLGHVDDSHGYVSRASACLITRMDINRALRLNSIKTKNT